MRRRRQKLQVSTFPFLAVLLCAMGSLILLLLVLDRRAKVVARAKERERQEAVLAQYSKADRERMAAYEQKRRELRQRLQAQETALHANLDSKQTELQRKKYEANLERNRTAELKARLAALREVLAREQEGYEQEQRPHGFDFDQEAPGAVRTRSAGEGIGEPGKRACRRYRLSQTAVADLFVGSLPRKKRRKSSADLCRMSGRSGHRSSRASHCQDSFLGRIEPASRAPANVGSQIEGQLGPNEAETLCALPRAARWHRHLLPGDGRLGRSQHRFRI